MSKGRRKRLGNREYAELRFVKRFAQASFVVTPRHEQEEIIALPAREESLREKYGMYPLYAAILMVALALGVGVRGYVNRPEDKRFWTEERVEYYDFLPALLKPHAEPQKN